ncbi:sulfur carrier protein ThiS [Vibrio atypicus]|uniref:sulfur carrier protein ThiS n=1 Tax=Vibrio atypicus TaxID=558271 RepID=UPI0013594D4A|nr:sulfur carrier protein ThiS [Vibrio atypicus]
MNSIQITINGQVEHVADQISLVHIIELFSLPELGCVFAINNEIIPRSKWHETRLNNGDSISLFQAIAGG